MNTATEHQARLSELFRAEAREHLEGIQRSLGNSIKDRSERGDALKSALRGAHSVKGGATIAGFSALAALIHNWESCASAVASGKLELDEATLTLLIHAIDVVSDEVEASCDGAEHDATAIRTLMSELADRFGTVCELKAIELSAQDGPAGPRGGAEGSIRVATRKLDRQMASIEELLRLNADGPDRLNRISRNLAGMEQLCARLSDVRKAARELAKSSADPGAARLSNAIADLLDTAKTLSVSSASVSREVRQATHTLSLLADALHTDARLIRMLPVETAFGAFSRMVRDTARARGKEIVLELAGGDTEVDRDVLDAVKDPVMHLLRNAVDHGIESAEVRRQRGKPARAVIRIVAKGSAGLLEIEVSDDGGGIAYQSVGQAALERGVVRGEELAKMDEDAVRSLVFREGFSTAEDVTDLSGRGVGLAVVENAVDQLGGRVSFTTVEGEGTSFKLALPLNLSTTRLLLVGVGKERFAIPALSVERIVRTDRKELVRVDRGLAFELGGKPVAVCSLADALELPATPFGERLLVLVLAGASERCAFVVDTVTEEVELVARKLGEHLGTVPNISGVAVLPQGGLAPILNVADVLRSARHAPEAVFEKKEAGPAAVRRVLVVDDSLTTRILEKTILEAAGYEVETAVDGAEALERLRRSRFDVVLSDVQMPKVDGLSLVRSIKKDSKTKKLPVVLVSSLDTAEQRLEGLEAGADAYLSKGEFEQGLLLSTLERFAG